MANLCEAYKSRLAIAERFYSQKHAGEKLSESKKLVTAKVLENTNKFLNEAFENSVGTQRSDLGLFKKFALNLTTVALPNLIAHDLVIVHPMSSMSGYVNYVQYTRGSNKGAYVQGDVINDPFRLGSFKNGADGKLDTNYTAAKVCEALGKLSANGAAFDGTLRWTPVIPGTVEIVAGAQRFRDYTEVDDPSAPSGKRRVPNAVDATGSAELSDGAGKKGKITYATGKVTFDASQITDENVTMFVNYVYDNVVIPQNDLPIINAEIKAIPLIAKARRIAIYYSQIAAFQAKTDYGMDLGAQLAEKAVGELSYEIDTEITSMLVDNASESDLLSFNKALPMGVSKAEHYEGFAEVVEIGKQLIYDNTKRFAPTYMLIASDILPILSFVKGFSAASTSSVNGPYFAGTLNGLKVFVTPNVKAGTFVLGVNGDDMMSSAAVYAPYMAIVPTQLLGYADGGMSQGWSTMYDLKMLNAGLLVKGTVKNDPATANAQVINTKAQG